MAMAEPERRIAARESQPGPGELVRTYRMNAPNLPETPRVARDLVAALLRATELSALVDVGRLLVSEVVTNVHLHASVRQLTLEATVRSGRVLVSVLDTDPRGVPQIRRAITGEDACADAESGRGLPLVEHFAAAWGTTWFGGVRPTGKSVWFELHDESRE